MILIYLQGHDFATAKAGANDAGHVRRVAIALGQLIRMMDMAQVAASARAMQAAG
jgi:hypothetical protein